MREKDKKDLKASHNQMDIWSVFDHDIRGTKKKKRGNGRVQCSFINFINITSLSLRKIIIK